jgi:peptide deformylase
MKRVMYEREGVGLAANQIGRLKRIFVAAYEDEEYVIVNPEIDERSETVEKEVEGCLSIPETRVEVERPTAVAVTGQDLSGEPVRVEVEGLLARIFQHEIDHLDGILILDRTDRESRKNAMREIRERMLAQR